MVFRLHAGDVVEVCRGMPANSFDGLLSDPPYGLEFMGKDWDRAVPGPDVWREVLRVLKPGAYALVFGGTRTFHRLAVAMEDAGFEIRDCLMWLYGSGFPKSLDVSKAIDKQAGIWRGRSSGLASVNVAMTGANYVRVPKGDPATPQAAEWEGYGTALKPAWEPIILARKPLDGTVAHNALTHGTGGLNIDGCRIGESKRVPGSPKRVVASAHTVSLAGYDGGTGHDPNIGRWPANLILDEEAGAALDAQSGFSQSTPRTASPHHRYGLATNFQRGSETSVHADSGVASRFFYSAKVSTRERNRWCEYLEQRSAGECTGGRVEGSDGLKSPRAGASRTGGAQNHHPTLKPIALNEYLARLILPPSKDARILVPFCGSGSELVGASRAGWANIDGIERDENYVKIAQTRTSYDNGPLFARAC